MVLHMNMKRFYYSAVIFTGFFSWNEQPNPSSTGSWGSRSYTHDFGT